MTGAEFEALATTRRSIRVYRPDPIPRSLTRTLLDLATRAPSNFNRQPWRFIVADDPSWCRAIRGVLQRNIARAERADTSEELSHVVDHVRTWLHPLETSPLLVLAFYKPSSEWLDSLVSSLLETGSVASYNPNLVSLGMAIQNLLLAAHAFGLSACMHSGPLPFLRTACNRLLGLPAQLQLAGLISLGYPAESPKAPPHLDLERTVTFLHGEVPASWAAAEPEPGGAP